MGNCARLFLLPALKPCGEHGQPLRTSVKNPGFQHLIRAGRDQNAYQDHNNAEDLFTVLADAQESASNGHHSRARQRSEQYQMQTQHLGFHRATDHRRRSAEAPAPPRAQSREQWQRRVAKIAPSGNALRVALCCAGCFEGLIGGQRCIGELERGHIDRDRHREHRSRRRTSQMRHFLELTFAPRLLPSGVALSAPTRALVARTRSTARLPARHRRTLAGTKNIAVIAAAADAHRHAAAPAAIQPVALLPLLHRTPPQHWTAPGFAGLNDMRKIAPTGIAPLEAPGVLIGSRGLLCLGVAVQLRAERRNASRPRQSRTKTDAGTSAADRGRLRFVYV
jgi:hypothetical protein